MSPMSFVRRFTLIEFDRDALNRHEIESLKLAKEEGFSTHGASFLVRSELKN
jgi:histidinol dehydrogenase